MKLLIKFVRWADFYFFNICKYQLIYAIMNQSFEIFLNETMRFISGVFRRDKTTMKSSDELKIMIEWKVGEWIGEIEERKTE